MNLEANIDILHNADKLNSTCQNIFPFWVNVLMSAAVCWPKENIIKLALFRAPKLSKVWHLASYQCGMLLLSAALS